MNYESHLLLIYLKPKEGKKEPESEVSVGKEEASVISRSEEGFYFKWSPMNSVSSQIVINFYRINWEPAWNANTLPHRFDVHSDTTTIVNKTAVGLVCTVTLWHHTPLRAEMKHKPATFSSF